MEQPRPTFSESWYRVAGLKARLRASAQISRQHYRGERWYVVRDPAGNQFHRLSAPAYKFVGLLDGTRTVAEAWELVGGQLADEAPTQNEVIQILSQLHAANLVEADLPPDAAVLLKRHKRMVKRQWQGRMMNVLFPRIPLWDVDSFLVRWMPVMRPMISWMGAIIWVAAIIGALATVLPRWGELASAARDATNPNNWIFLWVSFVLIKAIHELGHAFACRRFGGEVHELGVMFLVFIPTPYVDASTAWSFPSKWARFFVGAAGMVIELFVAAIAAFVWANTGKGLVNELAYNTMLIASVSTVIFNANPLLRYDGYYMLSDLLEIPNLRYRSTEYALGLIKRHLFRVKSQFPLPPVGQRIWLFSYAILSGIYRIFVGIMIILIVSDRVPVLGVLMAIGGLITWAVVPIGKIANYLLLNAELHRKRVRAGLWTAAIAGGIVVLIGVIPFTPHFNAEAVLEPMALEALHVQTPGPVKVVARDGQFVRKGEPIVIARDDELDSRIQQKQAQLAGLDVMLAWAQAQDQSQVASLASQIRALSQLLQREKQLAADLVVRAPFDGQLVAPRIRDLEGQYLERGTEIGFVQTVDQFRIRAVLDQNDAALVLYQPATEAKVRLAGSRKDELTAQVDRDYRPVVSGELPHAGMSFLAGGNFATDPRDPSGRKLLSGGQLMYMRMDNPNGRFYPGQRAVIRFELTRRPLAWDWNRRFWQLVQQHSHTKWL